mmetsp:Transcript_29681/g.61955  ORF Transcript_29681/g.61955 Transcript_29681/m.61955 type:complete len:347 (-) Transcript_29681:22-1062(-)
MKYAAASMLSGCAHSSIGNIYFCTRGYTHTIESHTAFALLLTGRRISFRSNEYRRQVDPIRRDRNGGGILLRQVRRIATSPSSGRRVFLSVIVAEGEAVERLRRRRVHRLLFVFVPKDSILADVDDLGVVIAPAPACEMLSRQRTRENARELRLVGFGIVRPSRVAVLQLLGERDGESPRLDVIPVQLRPRSRAVGGSIVRRIEISRSSFRHGRGIVLGHVHAAARAGARFLRFAFVPLPRCRRFVMPGIRCQRWPIPERISRDVVDFFFFFFVVLVVRFVLAIPFVVVPVGRIFPRKSSGEPLLHETILLCNPSVRLFDFRFRPKNGVIRLFRRFYFFILIRCFC